MKLSRKDGKPVEEAEEVLKCAALLVGLFPEEVGFFVRLKLAAEVHRGFALRQRQHHCYSLFSLVWNFSAVVSLGKVIHCMPRLQVQAGSCCTLCTCVHFSPHKARTCFGWFLRSADFSCSRNMGGELQGSRFKSRKKIVLPKETLACVFLFLLG